MRIVIKRPRKLADPEQLMALIEQARGRGLTAREAARKLGLRDAVDAHPSLHLLVKEKRAWCEFSPCPDWREHHAVQESRYYASDQSRAESEETSKPARKVIVLKRPA